MEPNKKIVVKWAGPVALVIFCITLFLIALAPTALSSGFGAKLVASTLSKKMNAKVFVEGVRFRWFGAQEIDGIIIRKPGVDVTIQEVVAHRSLFNYLTSTQKKKEISIYHPQVELSLKNQAENSKAPLLLLTQTLGIYNGSVTILLPDGKETSLENIDLSYSTKTHRFLAKGATVDEGIKGSFSVDAHANLSETATFSSGSVSAELNSFPVAAIDKVFGFYQTEKAGLVLAGLGPRLDGKIQCVFAPPQVACEVALKAENLDIHCKTVERADGTSLDPRGEIHWKMTPQFLKRMTGDQVTLFAPTKISITPSDLKISGGNRPQLSGAAVAKFSACTLHTKALKKAVQIQNTKVALKKNLGEKHISLDTDTGFYYGTNQRIPLKLACSLPLENTTLFTKEFLETLYLKTERAPTEIASIFTKSSLASHIGPHFSLNILPQEPGRTMAILETPCVDVEPLFFTIDNACRLEKEVAFSYVAPTTSFRRGSLFQLKTLGGKLSSLKVPLEGCKEKFISKGSVFTEALKVNLGKQIGAFSTELAELSFDANGLDQIRFSAKARADVEGEKQLAFLALGNHCLLNTSGIFSAVDLSIPKLDVDLTSEQLKTQFKASVDRGLSKLQIKEQWNVFVNFAPDILHKFVDPKHRQCFFTQCDPLAMQMSPTTMSLTNMGSDLHLDIEYKLPSLALHREEGPTLFLLENNTGSIQLREQRIELCGAGVPKAREGQPGKYLIDFSWDRKTDIGAGTCKFQDVPNAMLDLVTGNVDHLSALLGEKSRGEFSLSTNPNNVDLSVGVETSTFQGKGAFTIDKKTMAFSAKEPVTFRWEMTNKAFTAITQGLQQFTLKKNATVTGNFAQIQAPLQNLTAESLRLQGQIQSGRITVENTATKEEAEFYKPTLTLQKKERETPLLARFKSDVRATTVGKRGPSGTISMDVKYLSCDDYTALFDVRSMPTMLADAASQIIYTDPVPVSYVTGEHVSMRVEAKSVDGKGDITATLDSPNCKAETAGVISGTSAYLTKPLKVECKLSQAFGDHLLSSYNISYIGAMKPLTLTVPADGTRIPLCGSFLTKAVMPKIILDLGKISCKNQGSTHAISSLFKLNIKTSTPMLLWFAPIEARLSRGVLTIGRTEVLFNQQFEIATWGSVDFRTEQVNMMVGLTNQSLHKALGIKDLPHDFVIPVPLQGSFDDVKLEKEIGAAKIALLYARKKGMTPTKGAWGSVFDALGTLAEDQRTVPHAKHPFPWEERVAGNL